MAKTWSKKFLSSSPKERNKKKRKSNYNRGRNNGCKFKVDMSREEMLEWGRKNGIRIVDDMRKIVSETQTGPSFKQLLKVFGSWKKYRDELGIFHSLNSFFTCSDEDYIRLCIRFRIRTREDYKTKYQQYKGIMFSINKLEKRFGGWLNFKRLLFCCDFDRIMDAYVEKSIERGHRLTLDECDELGIEIRNAMSMYSKTIFNRLVAKKEKLIYEIGSKNYEKGIGNQGTVKGSL